MSPAGSCVQLMHKVKVPCQKRAVKGTNEEEGEMCAEIKAMPYTRTISKLVMVSQCHHQILVHFRSSLSSCLLSSLLHHLVRKVLLATPKVQPRLLLQEVAGMSSPPKGSGSSWSAPPSCAS